ncbi:MAG: hypothetical protein J6S92_03815 [Oscillospiraceae bacterium]|nr:hypothetical protein [Oscillospiraceae bacterium]
MEDWKERLKAEYKELKERLDKLHKWNVKQEAAHRSQRKQSDISTASTTRKVC